MLAPDKKSSSYMLALETKDHNRVCCHLIEELSLASLLDPEAGRVEEDLTPQQLRRLVLAP
jgi:hypothetical protein